MDNVELDESEGPSSQDQADKHSLQCRSRLKNESGNSSSPAMVVALFALLLAMIAVILGGVTLSKLNTHLEIKDILKGLNSEGKSFG